MSPVPASAIQSLLALDDTPVYDAYVASRMTAALAASVRLGLFERLEERPMTAAEMAQALSVSLRGATALLIALDAMGMLSSDDGTYGLTDVASAYLVRGKPGWLGGLIDLEVDSFLSADMLLKAMKSGVASVYGGEDPWAEHEINPDRARAFTAAMHSVSERPAAGLAERVDFSTTRRLLDVGGGSGVISIALARRWETLRTTVLDLAVVCPITDEYVARAGLSERIDARPGNMFKDDLPTGYDAVLFSQILHDWSFETGAMLLQKAWDALPSGGRVLIHEKLVSDDTAAPLANTLVNLDMMVWTEGQQYTAGQLTEMLESIGFQAIRHAPTTGYWTVVWATKP